MPRNLLPVLLLLAVTSCGFAAETMLYVAPTGNDRNAGTIVAPLGSVTAARDAVRALRMAGNTEQVTVLLRGGTYKMAEPFALGPQDSNVTYAAYAKERPILSGGETITGFTQGPGKLWTAKVPGTAEGQWQFNQLWVNGQRRRPARTPNDGFFYVAGKAGPGTDADGKEVDRSRTAFAYTPGELKPWADIEQANVIVFHSWETSRLRIKELDEKQNVVTFTGGAAWPFERWGKGQRYYVEFVREGLDAPGEWYLDRQAGQLLYYPMPGEDMKTALVVAPRLTQLVDIRGDGLLGLPVSNVTFSGLTFMHEDYVLEPEGHSDPQAVFRAPAAIMADGATGCTFENCEIAHVGDYGLWLRLACKNNRIVKCRIRDLGIGAVRIGTAANAGSDAASASGNLVDNCHLYDGGHVYQGGVGLWIGQSFGNRISHNEIRDFTYSGMSIGWTWGDDFTRCRDNITEFNHVHHVMNGWLDDGGAIYTLGNSPGSVIRNNVFHDVWPYKHIGWGIYLDGTTNRYLVENNVTYNTFSGGLMYHNGGHEHVIRNNVFAYSARQALWPFYEKRINSFRNNIVYFTQGDLFISFSENSLKQRLAENEKPGDWDNNVYFNPNNPDFTFYNMTFPEWQALGMDQHSVVADPQFVNPAKYDFRLKPTSPALALGFKQIDTSTVGLYGDAAWVNEARNFKYPPTVLPGLPPPPPPLSVDDGFETTVVGAEPDLANTSEPEGTASIRVTDEQAARGKHSLKFTDAPGLSQPWQPHTFYSPHFLTGKVLQSFDLRIEPGAKLYTEWRDNGAYPDNIGPSLEVDAEGNLTASKQPLLKLPVSQWVHIKIEGAAGKDAARTYDVTVTLPGAQPQRFEGIPNQGKNFRELHWLGFVSLAEQTAVFYVDNVKIELVK
ncbi:MAG: right-handed parallel beta-helix repeat-containing protein [Armatimonadota bacterium]